MSRGDRYPYFLSTPTRWMDNDIHGHAGSVVYYAYFDTAICRYLLLEAGIDIARDGIAPFTVENGCRYRRSLSFPEVARVGLRVDHIGTSSVRYGLALFGDGHDEPLADGHFVDVFVERLTHRAVPIPEAVRKALRRLCT